MVRAALVFSSLLVVSSAVAEPATTGEPAAEPAADAERTTDTPAATPALPFPWRPAAEPAPPVLDLTPSRVLRTPIADRRGGEERPGIGLGDDGGWKEQAAQVGGMAAGWVALTALCRGGACRLPGGLTDWMPGLGPRDDIGVPAAELRPQPPLREAR